MSEGYNNHLFYIEETPVGINYLSGIKRWKEFYNKRWLHGSLGNNTPAYIWKQYEQEKFNREQQMTYAPKLYSQRANGNPFKLK